MNKIEIRRFLESEEKKTAKNIRDIKDREEEQAKRDIIIGCPIDLQTVQVKLEELFEQLEPMQEYFENQPTYTWQYTYISNVLDYLVSTINVGVLSDLTNSLDAKHRTETAPKIKYENQKEILSAEYSKLRGNISNMTGKEATDYLIELGFVLPEQFAPVKNEVMSPINISLLKELRGAING